jgi:hypothetical protein
MNSLQPLDDSKLIDAAFAGQKLALADAPRGDVRAASRPLTPS